MSENFFSFFFSSSLFLHLFFERADPIFHLSVRVYFFDV